MIKQVPGIHAELDGLRFCEIEAFAQRHIEVIDGARGNRVSATVGERALAGCNVTGIRVCSKIADSLAGAIR